MTDPVEITRLDELQAAVDSTAIYSGDDPVSFYMLGLAGEVGSALGAWKKEKRGGEASSGGPGVLAGELGDALWYLTQIANELNLDLAHIASNTVIEARDRWQPPVDAEPFLDESAPPEEQIPRLFQASFSLEADGTVCMEIDGRNVGNHLNDNAHVPDNYRFHDIFHLAFAAVLGWSPLLRSLLKRKRKYDTTIDEVEDGARAIFTEEGIAALIFVHAGQHAYFASSDHVDTWLLDYVMKISHGFEVADRSAFEWESAILQGYSAWRAISDNGGGTIECDLNLGTISVVS